jgi:hypothetical protein
MNDRQFDVLGHDIYKVIIQSATVEIKAVTYLNILITIFQLKYDSIIVLYVVHNFISLMCILY